jgi:hypothetical protein
MLRGIPGQPHVERSNPLAEDARAIVEMLASHELAIKQLYQTYALRFPSFKDLWLGLAADEQRHADWLGSLVAHLSPANPLAPCGWPRPAAIESSLEYIQVQLLRARRPEFSAVAALSIAKDLENSLLEKEFFKVAQGASPEVREVLGQLVTGTERHWRTVAEALDRARRGVLNSV